MEIVKLTPASLGACMELQTRVHREMQNPQWLYEADEEETAYILSGGGVALGICTDGVLRGLWMIYDAQTRPDSLYKEAGLPREGTMHFEMALLDPELQGQGLHTKMAAYLTELAEREGLCRALIATVHPDNFRSLNGFLRCGYEIRATQPLYNGSMRHVLVKLLDPAKASKRGKQNAGDNDFPSETSRL